MIFLKYDFSNVIAYWKNDCILINFPPNSLFLQPLFWISISWYVPPIFLGLPAASLSGLHIPGLWQIWRDAVCLLWIFLFSGQHMFLREILCFLVHSWLLSLLSQSGKENFKCFEKNSWRENSEIKWSSTLETCGFVFKSTFQRMTDLWAERMSPAPWGGWWEDRSVLAIDHSFLSFSRSSSGPQFFEDESWALFCLLPV